MICSRCKKNTARYTVQTGTGAGMRRESLCDSCYAAFMRSRGVTRGSAGARSKACPFCGSTLEDYLQSGLLGCARCYETFSDELAGYIVRLHGNTVHCGKRPSQDPKYEAAQELRETLSLLAQAQAANDGIRVGRLRRKEEELRQLLFDDADEEAAQPDGGWGDVGDGDPEGAESTVISTRVRLARNLAGYPFPHRLENINQSREIVSLLDLPLRQLDDFTLSYTDEMSESELQLLKENYIISEALIRKRGDSAVYVNRDEDVSVMVNEEDHIREQYCVRGLHLFRAYEYLSGIDDAIGDCVQFAYDSRLGYLTACPTNLGTGLRASVMLFLPAITRREDLFRSLRERVRRQGMVIRGVYGEGSEAEGCMYQISNDITLGMSEQELLRTVSDAVHAIVTMEVRAREELYEKDPVGVRDACGRAYGILTNCARLKNGEFLRLMTDFKLGAALGLYGVEKISELDDLVIAMRDSNIGRFSQETLDAGTREIYRAECVRERLLRLTRGE